MWQWKKSQWDDIGQAAQTSIPVFESSPISGDKTCNFEHTEISQSICITHWGMEVDLSNFLKRYGCSAKIPLFGLRSWNASHTFRRWEDTWKVYELFWRTSLSQEGNGSWERNRARCESSTEPRGDSYTSLRLTRSQCRILCQAHLIFGDMPHATPRPIFERRQSSAIRRPSLTCVIRLIPSIALSLLRDADHVFIMLSCGRGLRRSSTSSTLLKAPQVAHFLLPISGTSSLAMFTSQLT